MENIIQNLTTKVNNLKVFDENIEYLIKNGVIKTPFSIFGSDYKSFNQKIEKTKEYLDEGYPDWLLQKLKQETSFSSIIQFLQYSKIGKDISSKLFEQLYQFLIDNKIKLINDSKLNRLLFKAISRLSFSNENGVYIFPKIVYEENYLMSLNNNIDEIAREIKNEGLIKNPDQGSRSNILAWLTNIGIEEENLKTFLSLFWEEQDNMYEQKLWFFIGYLLSEKKQLEEITEDTFNQQIISLKNNSQNGNFIKESEPLYNGDILPSKFQIMEKLTSQESLLLLSLLTKPFSILYGVSGTGKSRVVRELWRKIYGEENIKEYFYKEPVPPNWFDESEIIGRHNEIEKFIEGSFITVLEKAIRDSNHNYIYLLDEMNLSHIEQYFSQYLSAIEELNDNKTWITAGKKSNYIIGSKNGIDFEKYNKKNEDIYVSKYYLDTENFENLSYKNINKIINAIDKDNYAGNFNGKKIKGVSIKGEITSFTSNRKTYNYIIQYLIDNYFDNLDKIEKCKNIFSRNREDINYGDYAIEEYNGFFYANNFSTNETIRHIFDLINEYAKSLNKDDILLLTDDVELLEQEGFINNLEKLEIIGKSLKLQNNLFVVGTINLDETTKSISPKVVDRANLIEFNDLDDFLFMEDTNKYDLSFLKDLTPTENFKEFLNIRKKVLDLKDTKEIPKDIVSSKDTTQKSLKDLYSFLKIYKLHFSYRTLKEIIIFINIGLKLFKDKGIDNLENRLFDIAVMQKILPKLNGIIDYNFKLHCKRKDKDGNCLWYDFDSSDENLILSEFKSILESGFYNKDNNFLNTTKKLKRMQHFFDTYQNVNYFLS